MLDSTVLCMKNMLLISVVSWDKLYITTVGKKNARVEALKSSSLLFFFFFFKYISLVSYWHNLILVISQLVIMCLHDFKQVNSNWLSIISKVTSCISSLPFPVEKADSYYSSLMLQDSKQMKRVVILKYWLISNLSVLWYKNVLWEK